MGNHIPINKTLQRQWRDHLIKRASIKENLYHLKGFDLQELSCPRSCITAPLSIRMVTKPLQGVMEVRTFKPPGAAYQFLFCISSGDYDRL